MKVNLRYSKFANSKVGRTVASAVGIAQGRRPEGAWVEEPDKEPELEHRQEEQDKTRVLLELSDLR